MQVEDLTVKSEVLEAKLERTSRRLKEATATAHEEAEKYKATKEVIRSLTAQVKKKNFVLLLYWNMSFKLDISLYFDTHS